MVRKKIPIEIKYALVLAYGQRCSSCSEFKEDVWKDRNLVIDHIIPIKYEQQKYEKERKEVFSKFELPDSFDLNGILNLRPLCANCNNTKSDALFGETTQLVLKKAKDKSNDVKKYIKKFNTTPDVLVIMKSLEQLQDSGASIEDILDEVTGMNKRFSNKKTKEIGEGFDFKVLKLENSNGSIISYLPTERKLKGNCLFMINSHYVREAMITLDHSEILSRYYGGSHTPIELGMRKYLTKNFDGEGYYVDLGNTRIFLKEDQTTGFIDILDDFIDEYVDQLLSVYEKKEITNFSPRDSQFDEFHIATSSVGVWNVIDQFTKEHDYQREEGDSWNIFDARCSNMIKVIDPKTSDFKAFINVKESIDYFGNIKMEYYWWDIDDSYEKNLWTIIESQEWLLDQLLPKVLDEHFKENSAKKNSFSFFKRKNESLKEEIDYSNFMSSNQNVIIRIQDLLSIEDIVYVLVKLEDLYKRRINYVNIKIESLSRMLIETEKAFKQIDLAKIKDLHHQNYIQERLPNKIDEVKKRIEENTDTTWIEGYVLGTLFEVLAEMISNLKYDGMKERLFKLMKSELIEYIDQLNERRIIQEILNVYK